MQEFIAIDFETANPKRVSACAFGYAKVCDCEIIETNGFLIKPVGLAISAVKKGTGGS